MNKSVQKKKKLLEQLKQKKATEVNNSTLDKKKENVESINKTKKTEIDDSDSDNDNEFNESAMNTFQAKTSSKGKIKKNEKKKVVIINNDDDNSELNEKSDLKKNEKISEDDEEDNTKMLEEQINEFPSDESSEEESNNEEIEESEDESDSDEISNNNGNSKISSKKETNALTQLKVKETQTRDLKDLWLSICLPDSCIQKCQSPELRNHLISQIARAACIFMVDEIVLIRDHSFQLKNDPFSSMETLTKILQYLETPQYLRKSLFPISQELKYVGLMAPLECYHHLKINEYCKYREGVTLKRPIKDKDGAWVDIGQYKQVKIPQRVVAGTRVTVSIDQDNYLDRNFEKKFLTGTAVSPLEPKKKEGYYWGYSVRNVKTFPHLYNVCPNPKGYQLKICVDSKFGKSWQEIKDNIGEDFHGKKRVESVQVFFSGIGNLDSLMEGDELSKVSSDQALKSFDYVIKMDMLCGVRILHVEEEIMLVIKQLRDLFNKF